MRLSRVASLVSFACLSVPAAAQSTWSQHGEVLISSGSQVPGLPAGITIGNVFGLDAPMIDQNGTILFRGLFADTGGVGGLTSINNRGYLLGRASGDLALAVRSGDPAPGIPGAYLRAAGGSTATTFPLPRLSAYGEKLFFAATIYDPVTPANTPATSDTALFAGPVGSITLVAREGVEVPWLPPGSNVRWGHMHTTWNPLPGYYNLGTQINADGRIVVNEPLTGSVTTLNDAALVTGLPGSLAVVRREGDVLPDGSVVAVESGSILSYVCAMNEAGQVLHTIRFSTTSGTATPSNDTAVALWTAGTDQILLREDQDAPGFAPGTVKIGSTNPSTDLLWVTHLTRTGRTGAMVPLRGPGISAGVNDLALYILGPGAAVSLVLQCGVTPAPAGTGGTTFSAASPGVAIVCNDDGSAVLWGNVNGLTSDVDGVMCLRDTSGNITLLAQEGDPAPGVPGWTRSAQSLLNQTCALNDRGQIVWSESIYGPLASETVLYSYDPSHGCQLVAHPQVDTYATPSGTVTLSQITTQNYSPGNDSTCQSWCNNNGDWTAMFLDTLAGYSIVRGHVGSLVAVPSSVPVAGGVPQNFYIDCGSTYGGMLYIVLASGLGTRPGFPSPLGPQNVPLNFDFLWTMLSINSANSPLWINTLGFLDANGKGIGPSSFVMPPGYPGFLGNTVHHAALVFDGTLTSQFVTEPSALKFF